MLKKNVMPIRLLMFGLLLCIQAVSAESFVFKDMQGRAQRLQDYHGKWVLVNFWATWCPPCLEEIPDLIALAAARKDIVVIGVVLDSTRESVAEFVMKKNLNYPIVIGDYDLAQQVGEVDGLPTSYLYDPAGKLVSYQEGKVTRASIESYIKGRSDRK